MIVLDARNVNYALPIGIDYIHRSGVREPSRNGDVLRATAPVTTVYERPTERVCFHPWRDANPFFHLIESLWMIAGRDDLAWLTKYVSTFGQFSDDGETVPGAYGKRWRDWRQTIKGSVDGHQVDYAIGWGDQLDRAVAQLRANPHDRRVVIQMWDPAVDPDRAANGGKDVPCNLTVLPFVVNGKLNITVFCRSNDMMLGAYGANAVHFSFLLEYLAGRTNLGVGRYYQVSNNFHAYVSNCGDPAACWPTGWGGTDPYAKGEVEPFPLFKEFGCYPDTVDSDRLRDRIMREDLAVFFEEGAQASVTASRWPFLTKIAVPMALAHRHWKGGEGVDRFRGALEILKQMPARNDWRRAAEEWIIRRYDRWTKKQEKAA